MFYSEHPDLKYVWLSNISSMSVDLSKKIRSGPAFSGKSNNIRYLFLDIEITVCSRTFGLFLYDFLWGFDLGKFFGYGKVVSFI